MATGSEDSPAFAFSRAKRGHKLHAIPKIANEPDRAACGYEPSGYNPNYYGWVYEARGVPCLLCEDALVRGGHLDAASELTGKLYDPEPQVAASPVGLALAKVVCAEASRCLTSWYSKTYGDAAAVIIVDPASVAVERKRWTATATLDRNAGHLHEERETVNRDIEGIAPLDAFFTYGAMIAECSANGGPFRVQLNRPSGSPRIRRRP